jgi:aryl-alcohol dehydrogenase-like predicted oxidoreductase
MHTRKIGPFDVSAIGLGCMNISMGYGPADEAESEQLLRQVLENGYTFLDTAAVYGMGHSEELIGRTLADRRSEYMLASKCGLVRGEKGYPVPKGHPAAIVKTCEESLQRLRTDVIDLYYLHRVDPNVPVEESVGALANLVSDGKIRTIGLSEVCADTLRRAHVVHPITAVQSEYSLWSRTPERKMLAVCRELDVTFVPFAPLARGFLAGSAQDVTHLQDNDIRCTNARPRFEPEAFAENTPLLEPFQAIAEEQGCTMGQLALAWVLAREDRTLIPIPGTKNAAHMAENAGAGDIALDDSVVERLDQLINETTVVGRRYTDAVMTSIDSERD